MESKFARRPRLVQEEDENRPFEGSWLRQKIRSQMSFRFCDREFARPNLISENAAKVLAILRLIAVRRCVKTDD